MRDNPCAEELEAWIIRCRREFHQYPELGFEEYKTQKRILTILGELGIKAKEIAETGVIAGIRGRLPGPCIALRSDMDGLKIQEELTERNRDYISRNDGVMHACGHDGHMAMLLGAARLFQENRDFPGEVRLIFQPAEEVFPGGAERVISGEGLKGVDAILGLHIFSDYESGSICMRPGPFMASAYKFKVVLYGKGGHIAKPERIINPIRMANEFLVRLYSALEEQLEPERYVFGVGRIQSGDLYNIVPDRVEILGSYRTFDMDTTDCINRTINDCLDKVLEKYMRPGEEFFGLPTYTLDIQLGYPVLVNDPAFTCAVYSKLQESFPEQTIYPDIEKIFPSEDFSRYLEKVPGVFIMLGNCSPTEKIVRISHSRTFDIDEKILITGTKIFHIISMDFLKNPTKYLNPQKFGYH